MIKRFNLAVTIDGPKVSIELPAESYQEVIEALSRSSARHLREKVAEPSRNVQDGLPASEKALVTEKKPHGHAEVCAVLAFSLGAGGTSEFTADDMRRAYIRAGVRPPKVVAQALRDAKNKYELIETGSKKGTFRLSAHGERTVLFDLPRAK